MAPVRLYAAQYIQVSHYCANRIALSRLPPSRQKRQQPLPEFAVRPLACKPLEGLVEAVFAQHALDLRSPRVVRWIEPERGGDAAGNGFGLDTPVQAGEGGPHQAVVRAELPHGVFPNPQHGITERGVREAAEQVRRIAADLVTREAV